MAESDISQSLNLIAIFCTTKQVLCLIISLSKGTRLVNNLIWKGQIM